MSLTFEQALRLSGLLPGAIIADGKWRRCRTEDKMRKKNGAYVLHPDGRGFWRNWAVDEGMNSWRDDNATQAKPIDQARIQAARDRERAYRVNSISSARRFWMASRPMVSHPYIDAKGLQTLGCAGLRVNGDLLVVPVRIGDSLTSIQTINAAGEKLFWPGAPVKAGCFQMRRQRASITVLVEGLATGLAVYQSVRNAAVIVCFDAGNLLPVAQHIKPSGSVVFAADNDWRTQARIGVNPGISKATKAAELIGAGVAYPDGIEGSDWADAIKEWGEGAQRRIERAITSNVKLVLMT